MKKRLMRQPFFVGQPYKAVHNDRRLSGKSGPVAAASGVIQTHNIGSACADANNAAAGTG
jgi:hypothetical protein